VLKPAGWDGAMFLRSSNNAAAMLSVDEFAVAYQPHMQLSTGPYQAPHPPLLRTCDRCKRECTSECGICGESFCSRACLKVGRCKVDSIKTRVENESAPGNQCWKLKCDDPLSNVAYKFHVRRYLKLDFEDHREVCETIADDGGGAFGQGLTLVHFSSST